MNNEMRRVVEEGYDKGDYAGAFRRDAEMTPLEQRLFGALLRRVPPGGRVLDLGSGTGLPFDRFLVDNGCDVTGIDISRKHVDSARRNVPEATYVRGDFSTIDRAAGSVDAVISLYAIFHIPRAEQAALFRMMHEWLRTGGVLLVSLGTSDSEYGEEDDWCGARMAWSTHTPERYRDIIAGAGFTIVETAFEGEPGDEEYHFWVFAEKS